jgi:lysophospholipase L1-like esterase
LDRLTFVLRVRTGFALTCLLAAGGCAKSPTTPTPPPPPPDPLKITCPAPVSLLSATGQPMSVHYNAATTAGGTAPVQISCTPANDSVFNVGATAVSCTATDAKSLTDSCSFTVTVTAPPRISLTSFVAFGDSMTAGEIVSEGSVRGFRILLLDPAKSYPTDLLSELRARYTLQSGSLSVANQGLKGETAVEGEARLTRVLGSGVYQVLLLMEGANDIGDKDTVTMNRALGAIERMVQLAKSRGLRVFLATLPPENTAATCLPNRSTGAGLLPTYNTGLRTVAATTNVTLVDVNAAFNGDLTLIDCDGLHPTALGYQRVADAFFASIRQTLEVTSTANPTLLTSPFVVPRGRVLVRKPLG